MSGHRLTRKIVLASVLCVGAMSAQPGFAAPQDRARTAPESANGSGFAELEAVLDATNALAPEISASVRIRIAKVLGGGTADHRQLSAALLEEAFYLATQARFPYRLEATDPQSTAMQSVEGAQSLALTTGLDGLALQGEALSALAATDAEKAVALFATIPAPRAKRNGCTDFLIPDTSEYHRTLAKLVRHRSALSKDSVERLVQWARDAASSIESTADLAGTLEMAASSAWTEEERRDLMELSLAAIGRMATSPQVPWPPIERVQRLVLSSDVDGTGLRSAWSEFLERQKVAIGCREERGESRQKADVVRLNLMAAAIAEGMQIQSSKGTQLSYRVDASTRPVANDGFDVRMLFREKAPRELFLNNPVLLRNKGISSLPERDASRSGLARHATEPSETIGTGALQTFQQYLEGFSSFRQSADIHNETAFHEICQLWQLAISEAPDQQTAAEQAFAYATYLDRTPIRLMDPPSWHRYALRLVAQWQALAHAPTQKERFLQKALPSTLALLEATRPGGSGPLQSRKLTR